MIAAKLFLIPVVIDPQGADPFALPKSAASRALLYVLCIVAVTYLARHRNAPRVTVLGVAVIAAVGAAGVATALALDPTSALYGAYRRYLGFTSILDGAAFAAGIALFVRTRNDLLTLGAASAAALFLTIGYGLLQLLGRDPVPWPEATLSSFIGNRTSLAAYLVISGAALFGVVLIFWTELRRSARAILLTVLAALVGLTISTSARAPTLAVAPSMAFATVIAYRTGRRAMRLGLIAGVAILLLAAGILVLSPTGERLAHLISGEDTSTAERSMIYRVAFEAIVARPVFGVGPDGMAAVYLALRPPETARMLFLTPTETSTHSWLLHYALGTGVVGLAAFVVMTAVGLVGSWGRVARPDGLAPAIGSIAAVAYLAQGLVTINSIVTDMLFWTSIGLMGVPPSASFRPHEDRTATRRADGRIAVLAVTIGLLLASSCWNVVEANRAIHASNLARAGGNILLAQRTAQVAVDRDPGRADAWNVLGLAYSRREPERAAQAFARAADRAPRDPVYWLNLAAEETVASQKDRLNVDSGVAHARRAMDLDPNGTVTLRRASEVFAALGRFDEAIAAARRAIELGPDEFAGRNWLAEVYAEAGRSHEAIAELERAISLNRVLAASPRLDLPRELRLRLSRLYRSTGQLDQARSLTHPPSVARVDRSCLPASGSAPSDTGIVLPRCLRVLFTSEEPLRDDPTALGSVRNVANYLVNGQRLPDGTTIDYDGTAIVTIQLPLRSAPLRPDSIVTVRRVADVLDQVMQPDPTSTALP